MSLLALAAVAYYRFEPVRKLVDAKCPWIKEQLAQRGIQFEGAAESAPALPLTAGAAKNGTSPVSAAAYPCALAKADGATSAPAKSLPPMDLAQLAANPSLWPKVVRIKKATEVPTVHNGQVNGKLTLPAGTEVKLISINTDKVGVAYTPDGTMPNAGGTWLPATDTDLLERVRNPR